MKGGVSPRRGKRKEKENPKIKKALTRPAKKKKNGTRTFPFYSDFGGFALPGGEPNERGNCRLPERKKKRRLASTPSSEETVNLFPK